MEEIQNTKNVYLHEASELNERLSVLVRYFTKGNVAAFARSIDMKQQSFDRLLKPHKENGKYPMVKPELVGTILTKYPSVHKVWLSTGIGPMLSLEDPQPPFLSYPSGVPYYTVDFAREFELIRSKKSEHIGYHIDFKAFNHADFWCNIFGRSMEPEIGSGDMVAMKEIFDKKEGILYGEMYGIVTKKFCVIRRVAKGSRDHQIKLIPSNKNPEYAEQEIARSAIENLFLVICCAKNL